MGISSATLSKVLNNDWDTISDDMWRSIAAQTGHDGTAWVTVATRGFERMGFILESAKNESLAMAVTGEAGCGKTEAIKHTRHSIPPLITSAAQSTGTGARLSPSCCVRWARIWQER